MSRIPTFAPQGSRGSCIAVDTLSTRGMWPSQSIEYWNDVACHTFTHQTVDALIKPFNAEMQRANVGDMRVAVAVSTPSVVRRSDYQVALSKEAYFLLHLQLAGSSLNRQDGREVQLEQGDFTIFDSTRPYEVEFRDDTSILVLRIGQGSFRSVIPCPEAITLVRMDGGVGSGRLASRFIENLWLALRDGVPLASASRLCRPVLDVVASAYAAVPDVRVECSSTTAALRIQLRSFIEEHLAEQDLSVSSIAGAFGITGRYVHALFKDMGADTVMEYVQVRRLEAASKALADPLSSCVSVGQIAIAHGFKSQAHFSRAFRARFGLTAREFRQRSCASQGGLRLK